MYEKSFDSVADDYDSVRPAYPPGLFERVIEFARLQDRAKVLEVGVGTGKATVPFAERGFEIVGIEPGANLAQLARYNLLRFPGVTIATTTFEAWTPQLAFDLAFCAQAFHWLDPQVRLSRFAEALRAGGILAIFGNVPSISPGALRDDLDAAYEEIAPSLSSGRAAMSWYASAESPVMRELEASDRFGDAQFTSFDWERTLDGASYGRLLSTYSDHSALPSTQLRSLLARVATVLNAHGNSLTISYTTGLFLARRFD